MGLEDVSATVASGTPGVVPGREASRLYFRQLLAGVDFATADPVARQMVNFVYFLGDRNSGEAVMIDPAYDIAGLLEILGADGMRCVGVLATHYHPDHVGGDLAGFPIEGIARLLELTSVPIHVQRDESLWVTRATGVGAGSFVEHHSGDLVVVGEIPVELVHTPGHTPGSQCFFVDGALLSGDTLFLDGCGRTDLPGSDPVAMYESLTTRLSRFSDGTLLFPGHRYAPESSATMGETRARNMVFRPRTAEEWLAVFG
jgi:glyoxylase-like metal-dependent hydrolase (beta-lactamase superfamily II)